MNDNARFYLIILNVICAFVIAFVAKQKFDSPTIAPPRVHQPGPPIVVEPEPIKEPEKPNISTPIPSYQDYDEIIVQLNEWHSEASDMTEVGTYGKSSKGKDLYYMRFGNLYKEDNPKVLLFGSIHGNESISTSTMMAFCGTLLSKYKSDPKITELLDTREIWIVPVVSPDSYPHSRWVDGVDPNRDWPSLREPNRQSVPPCKALQEFHLKNKFKAVLCGHSSGRWLLHPWSEIYDRCPHHEQYVDLLGRMSKLCGYKVKKSSDFYPGHTIVGGACDWFYRHGCFAMTPEFGSHQRKSTDSDIKTELDRVYEAFILYLQEAPLIEVPVIGFQTPRIDPEPLDRPTWTIPGQPD